MRQLQQHNRIYGFEVQNLQGPEELEPRFPEFTPRVELQEH